MLWKRLINEEVRQMKDALRNYLKEYDEVIAVYCKVVSLRGKPIDDTY